MIRYGLIGCGNIGLKRVNSLLNCKKSRLIIAVGPKTKDTKCYGKLISKLTGCAYTKDFSNIFNYKLDAVIISTPSKVAFEIAKKILNNKINLLIEKPLGLNLYQSKILTDLALKNEVFLKTGYNLRFDEGVKKIKELLIKNKIGRIYFIKIIYGNGTVLTNTNDIGSLLDIGTHSVNLVEFLLDTSSFDSYYNFSQKLEKFTNTNGFLFLKKKKILISIHHSLLKWKNDFYLEISGKAGCLKLESLPKWGRQTLTLERRVFPSGAPLLKKYFYFKDYSWINEWNFFSRKLKEKKLDKKIIKEGYNTMLIMEKFKKSLKK
jgi:predicted dehydrogenase